MAGIGFELRKVANKGGIGSFFQIAFSGAMIVSGPWILSIITITLIQTFLNRSSEGGLDLFMGVVIYSYAFSLFLFGGLHYIFTRRMSDLLYLKKEGQAFGYVLSLFVPIGLISGLIALPVFLSLNIDIPNAAVFKFSAIFLFVTVNCLWIIMLFVSVLKWFIRIMLVYSSGLAASLLMIYFLTPRYGMAGALSGFAAGHLLIVVLLTLLCRSAWKPAQPGPPEDIEPAGEVVPYALREIANFIKYISKHRFLFGTGIFYYAGIWCDKFIFWLIKGESVSGTFLKLYPEYDISVYFANLAMIPGLIFFVIYSETEFYTALKSFLYKLARGKYSTILQSKRQLAKISSSSTKEQSLLQGIITISLILIINGIILKITLAAVFFHLLFLTLLNYLFYIERYRHACRSSLVFFGINTILAFVTASGHLPYPGISYLIAAAAASVTAAIFLKRDILMLERFILTRK